MASRTSRSDLRHAVVLLLGCALLAAGCMVGGGHGGRAHSGGTPQLVGAGATFPAPCTPGGCPTLGVAAGGGGVKVAYQGGGSGAGVQRFMRHEVDFGASDVAMTDD
jgi:ABC-type phosphate transport system substrate-binding protein